MTKSPLLDTHVWVWWMLGDTRLSARERTVLDDLPSGQRPPPLRHQLLGGCDARAARPAAARHDALEDWLRIAASPAAVEMIPITPAVVAEMNRLPATFHQDPADRLIVATARVGRLPLATHDARIRRSRQTSLWVA